MILADHQIIERCEPMSGIGDRASMVNPFIAENVQPASIDVRLGNAFKVFERDNTPFIDMDRPADITKEVVLPEGESFMLHPGEFILGHTVERVNIPVDLVARIEGKSSIGRFGIFVHVTAGYIDPGYRGNVTLEMACLHPLAIRLWPGMLIAQLSFHEMSAKPDHPYEGRYQGDEGVASSRYHRDGKKQQ